MRAAFHQVHVHLVWATWDRAPVLDASGEKLRWQGGYGAFAVCRDRLDVVRAYVENQTERHAQHHLASELEMTKAEVQDAEM